MPIINEDKINNQMEEAWNEKDISKFNQLLCLKKRYQDGEDGIQEFNEHQESKQNQRRIFQILLIVIEEFKKRIK